MASATPPPDAPPSVPPAHYYEAGDTIGGKYLLEEQVGEGGMGSVWRARNLSLEVVVAVKLVAGTSDLQLLRTRLVREARTAARLRHPAIVQIFDVGETTQGDPFIVMEFLEGDTLGALLDNEGRLPATEAVRLLLPIADALHAAHARGLIHRDVKPDNVFIVREHGQLRPKLVDFGIVKIEGGTERHDQITEQGTFVGTPAYMSPEQARGREDLDRSTDIWAFAVTLFEAVSGHVPFHADNYNALLRAIVEDPAPSLASFDVQDERLDSILATGLAKDPKQRWPSMQAFASALASWLGDQKDGAEAPDAASRRRTRAYPPARPGSLASASLPSTTATDAGSGNRSRWVLAAAVAGVAILALVFRIGRSRPDARPGSPTPSVALVAASDAPRPERTPIVTPVTTPSARPVESAVPAASAPPVVTPFPTASLARPAPFKPVVRVPKPARDAGPKPDLMEPF
jgi:eukaryotic-like serine/threonine-protein kinase